MTFYPEQVDILAVPTDDTGHISDPSASGRAVSYECGCYLQFQVRVDDEVVTSIKFVTNGCGFMAAAGNLLCRQIEGSRLSELHGLADHELLGELHKDLGPCPAYRVQCLEVPVEALHAAFAELRAKRVADLSGDSALICTCFGISEDVIENTITANALRTVEQVTAKIRAGGGCGSCRMLIQEMLDEADML